jgi:hypothetical protein
MTTRNLVGALLLLPIFFVSACGGGEEVPVEQQEEEAGVEEVIPEPSPEETRVEEVVEPAKPTPEEIQAKGCPEGLVSNEAGTECYPEEHKQRAQEQIEQGQAQQTIRNFEEVGGPAAPPKLECQYAKVYLDLGKEDGEAYLQQHFEAGSAALKAGEQPRQITDILAEEGYDCAPPTPEELDKNWEKPDADPKKLEKQCGPQSNASAEFREKYC